MTIEVEAGVKLLCANGCRGWLATTRPREGGKEQVRPLRRAPALLEP